ncbi:MAG TPA: DNA polymerase III subunit beta [Candidatus Babeliales bacterium]|nr:DNA polymerase III subunit beta [Candidatus Babeliales bacterium]
MKKNSFVVDQKSFMTILSAMQPICNKRTTLDATTYIQFQVGHRELVLKSTDLEISLQSSYQLTESTIEEAVSFLVSGKRLFDLVKELDGDITFTLQDKQLAVQASTVQVSLNIRDAQDFPPFPERIENLMHMDALFLLNMLGKVGFLIPQNNSNPALNGLYCEITSGGLKMTTTDGHCLAQVSTAKYMLDQNKKWLLPRRAVFELKKLLESINNAAVFLGLCGNQLVFSGESFNFFTKLLADPFPQYELILNKDGFKPARVDKGQFIKALRRSSCLLSGQFIATQFEFKSHELHVSMQNKDVGKLAEKLSLEEFEGEAMDVRFYAPYLLSGMQAFADQGLQFHLKNSSKPIIFEADEQECHMVYLVMPVSPTAV